MKPKSWEVRKGIINAATQLNDEFTFIELMNACKKDGLILTETQIQASMTRSGLFQLNRERGLYSFKSKNQINQLLSAEEMKKTRYQFFNNKAEAAVQSILTEAFNKAKQGENTFFFSFSDTPNINDLIVLKLKELGYTLETSSDGAIIAW